jgi:hypothetical protein
MYSRALARFAITEPGTHAIRMRLSCVFGLLCL